MKMKSLFPVVITKHLREARDFYVEHFGFTVVFEADWYVQLHGSRGDRLPPIELAFMTPNVQEQPAPLHAAFSGAGIILTIEVKDVDEVHARLRDAGVMTDTVVPLKDEPWGQRHFIFRDPSGSLLDVVQQIQPSAEFAAHYVAKRAAESAPSNAR